MKRTFNSDQYMCCMCFLKCPMNVNDNYCVAYEYQYMVLDHAIAEECMRQEHVAMNNAITERIQIR